MIPDQVKGAMTIVYSYAGGLSDWSELKREIVRNTPSRQRNLFSLRNPVTKKQRINKFELEVISYWSELTNTEVIGIPEEVDDGTR